VHPGQASFEFFLLLNIYQKPTSRRLRKPLVTYIIQRDILLLAQIGELVGMFLLVKTGYWHCDLVNSMEEINWFLEKDEKLKPDSLLVRVHLIYPHSDG
jgi:hypothetical protein